MPPKRTNAPSQWTNPLVGAFVVFLSALGLLASVSLLQAELERLRDPDALLACDMNPLIGCSDSLLSPQAHLMVLPNSAVGMAAFGALLALGAVLLFKGSLPKVVWWGASAGMVVGLGFVSYFLYQSITAFRSLCPYCVLTWVAILGLLPLFLGATAASGALGGRARSGGETLLRYWWVVWILELLVVVLIVIVGLGSKISLLFA